MEVIFTDEELRAMNNHMGSNVEIDEADFVGLTRKLYSLNINDLAEVLSNASAINCSDLAATITAYIERHTK